MADIKKVIEGFEHCIPDPKKPLKERMEENECRHETCPYGPYGNHGEEGLGCFWDLMSDALELLKSKPDIDKIVKELDDTSKQYEPRPFESINWMLRYEGIRIGLEIAQYVVKGEPIPDKF